MAPLSECTKRKLKLQREEQNDKIWYCYVIYYIKS
jgi:hypothetical protein